MPKVPSKELPRSRSINVHLGAELKTQWTAYCEQMGKTPGAALKEAIEQQLRKVSGEPKPKVYQQVGEDLGREPKVRAEILLTTSEKAAIAERAALERCSQRRWIVDTVRAALTHEPQFSMGEIEALGESNYQLLAMGRSLNQMVRHLHENSKDDLTVPDIKALSRLIDKHTKVVSRAIRASLERWRIE